MPSDRWGNPLIYPRKPGGFYYEQSDNPKSDQQLGGLDVIRFGSGEMFTMDVSGSTSFYITTDPSFKDAIGGSNMDFTKTAERGYMYNSKDIRDVKLMCWVSIHDGHDHGLSISGPTGHHDSTGSCQAFAYMATVEYDLDPSEFRFRKEMTHPDYYDDPKTGQVSNSEINFKLNDHGWVGLCYVRYNVKDGISDGHDSVKLEYYVNPDPVANINNWILVNKTEDKGGWGSGGDSCGGANDQVGVWGGPHFRIKSNDTSCTIDIKHLSLIEIDPTLSFTDDPTPPPTDEQSDTSTVQGTFEFKQDINHVRVSACAGTGGGGGSGGSAKFYTIPTNHTPPEDDNTAELSDNSAQQNRKRLVMQVINSSSVFHGKTPTQIDIPLKKFGSPATNNVNVKIWSSSGAVIYTSPTNIADSSLTTSYVWKTFDLSTNTHALVTGDMIGVEYLGTSSSHYVIASYEKITQPNTQYRQYEGSTWENLGRRLAMDVWE